MLLSKTISPTLNADLEPLETIQRCPLTTLMFCRLWTNEIWILYIYIYS